MPDRWLPGVTRIEPTSARRGLTMTGSPRSFYFTWHTFEADPKKLTATVGARALNSAGSTPTFCLNPISGELVQMLPANVGCYTLVNESGGVQTNRAGIIHMQCEVIAYAKEPFTDYITDAGKASLRKIIEFAESWNVPSVWPAGQPLGSWGAKHNKIAPAESGHYSHSQWRENDHWDTGAISLDLWDGAEDEYFGNMSVVDIQRTINFLLGTGALLVDGISGEQTRKAMKVAQSKIDQMIAALNANTKALNSKALDPSKIWSHPIPISGTYSNVMNGAKAMTPAQLVLAAAVAARRSEVVVSAALPEELAQMREWENGGEKKTTPPAGGLVDKLKDDENVA